MTLLKHKKETKLSSIWWFNPINIYFGLIILVIYAYSVPASNYSFMYKVQYKCIDAYYLGIYIVSFVLFYLGVRRSKPYKYQPIDNCVYLIKTYKILMILCILAYAIWFTNFALSFGFKSLFSFLDPVSMATKMYLFKNNSGHIAGLTSMTEIGVVVAPLAFLLYKYTKRKIYLGHLILLSVFSLIRAVLFSERLAFLEIFVPFICVFLADRRKNTFFKFVPLYGIFFILFIFGLFEYVRSWSTYYAYVYNGTFIQFVLDRVLGYYSIAINTECTYIEYSECQFFPIRLIEWFWKIPGFSNIPEILGIELNYGDILENYGNPEFNNPGGMLVGFTDLGFWGLFYPYLLGYSTGRFYKSFKQRSLYGYILYPVFFLCILELPRYYYFGGNRALFVIIAAIVIFKKISSIHFNKIQSYPKSKKKGSL